MWAKLLPGGSSEEGHAGPGTMSLGAVLKSLHLTPSLVSPFKPPKKHQNKIK